MCGSLAICLPTWDLIDDVLRAVYGFAVNECVEVSDNRWSSVFTQHHLSKGCPCQDFLQPCGHEEAVDSSLVVFNLQSFILALMLPDDDIARSAVTVEGDRVDRDLGSLR